MTIGFARTDDSVFGRWWWTVDRWMLVALGLLIGFGTVLIAAASPPVARRIGLSDFHFVQRHIVLLGPALAIMIATSLLSPRGIRRLAFVVLVGALILLAATPFTGAEIKGARRWIQLPGLSIQPSEFVKPAFAVITAWLFTLRHVRPEFPGNTVATVLYALILGLLLVQPDLGMSFVVSVIWFGQFFLAGLPVLLVAILVVVGVSGLFGAYLGFDHVRSRVDRFLDPHGGDNYQVERSLQAFENGGLFGTGPGQGSVKMTLPDSHADFVFAVAGEEFGLFWCLVLVILFSFVILRGFSRALHGNSLFVLLATSGLLIQFGMQALINMGSALNLIPTKGMTLPFVSYGGSSLLALALGMGMVLALTRRHCGFEGAA